MIRNFFKTTLRSLLKNKTNSFLNIFGLAIGIACAGLIFLWVENETTYDDFNVKKDRLYFAMVNQSYDAGIFTHGSTPGLMGPALQKEIPGIANTCRMSEDLANLLFTVGDKPVYAGGKYVEQSIFSMFTLPFVQGNPKTAFSQLYSLVITEKTAKKFFGTVNSVVGKSVRMDTRQDFIVTGVIKDLPENSSLQFEWLAPFEIYYKVSPWLYEWGNFSLSTYVELKPEANIATVNKQVYNIVQTKVPASIGHIFLFGMNDWHLRGNFQNGKQSGGQIDYVHLFSIIAWVILFIACINFMNLSTARSEKRAREVGVRKVLGANKKGLIVQFIGEALILSMVAAFVAVAIMSVTLPAFNLLVRKNLSLGMDHPLHIVALLTIIAICGIVAGSYPSLYLSSFNPVFVLKGIKAKAGSAAIIRKGLVVIQFTVSIVLIISTMIIYQQIQHVKSRNLGFDKDNLLELPLRGDMANRYTSVRNDLLQTGVVENVALSDHTTIYGGNNTDGMSWEGKPPGVRILISGRYVTPEFMKTSGLKLIEGRDFHPTDSVLVSKNLNVVITESLAKLMGKGSAIGKTLRNDGDTSMSTTVVGVVNDYVYGNMYGKPDPVVFICVAPANATVMYVRIKGSGNLERTMTQIEAVMKKDNPSYPFDYRFVDEQFNGMFQNEMLISKLSRVFAALAIIISCLGLFGLAAYTAERRTKEIGIRKVLGASVSGITRLLSADFLKLVVLSALIAFPLSWWVMHSWLQGYSYRINISWWVFLIAGALSVIIALFTISFQSIKAALMNPVKSLRSE